LLAYTIEHAREAPSVERVIVSTDAPEIADVAVRFGAEVVWRPAEISGGSSPSEAALLHALDWLRGAERYEPDLVVFLQATSPIRPRGAVEQAIRVLLNEDADSLFSGCRQHGFLWRRYGGELGSFSYDFHHRPMRQQAPEDWVENGSIYVVKPQVLYEGGNRLGGKIAVYEMDFLHSLQVDEPGDLEAADRLLRAQGQPRSPNLGRVRLLALDFDGVLTDNKVLVDQDGREAVWCSRADGWGIARLVEAGVEVAIISTETNPVVAARARKLRVRCIQGCLDKRFALEQLAAELNLGAEQVAYVGNDENDRECLEWSGAAIAVADAAPDIRAICALCTVAEGGQGAVREIAGWILAGVSRRAAGSLAVGKA
jgi:N-acylneuraminate cytidylyltransferase